MAQQFRFEDPIFALVAVVGQRAFEPVAAAGGWAEGSMFFPALFGSALSLVWRLKAGKLKGWDIPWALVAGGATGYWVGVPMGAWAGIESGGAFVWGVIGAMFVEALIDNGGAELASAILDRFKSR